MEKLKVMENGLVTVYETSTGERVVYGTEMHKALGAPSTYREWVKRRLKDVEALEDEDFTTVEISTVAGGAPKKEHIIQLDTAKEMAMLERNEKGKQVRRYFIRIEKVYKNEMRRQIAEMSKLDEVYGKILENQQVIEKRQQIIIEMNRSMSDRLDALESRKEEPIRFTVGPGSKPFMVTVDENASRKKKLNRLVSKMAKACGWTRSFTLHRLYKTLEEVLDINIDDYEELYKEEIQRGCVCYRCGGGVR